MQAVAAKAVANLGVLEAEVFVWKLNTVNRLRSARQRQQQQIEAPQTRGSTEKSASVTSPPVPLPRVKSPPWSMNCGMTLRNKQDDENMLAQEQQ